MKTCTYLLVVSAFVMAFTICETRRLPQLIQGQRTGKVAIRESFRACTCEVRCCPGTSEVARSRRDVSNGFPLDAPHIRHKRCCGCFVCRHGLSEGITVVLAK